MRREREHRKRWLLWISALVIIILLLLRVNFRGTPPRSSETAPPVLTTVRPPSSEAYLRAEIKTKAPTAPEDYSQSALRKIRRAYAQLVRANSYRRVMTCFNEDGRTTRFTLVHLRDASGKDLFRCDTENVTENHPEESVSDRTEITNAAGNWQLRKTPGSDEVAMLVSSKESPITTLGTHTALTAEADERSSGHDSKFAETSYTDHGEPLVRIVETHGAWQAEYILDGSGNLISESTKSNGTPVSRISYEVNPSVNPDLFEIPKEKIALQTSDANNAASFLWEQNREASGDSVSTTPSKSK